MELKELHDCEKCQGKMVDITIDHLGNTHCGYCGERVNYSDWLRKEQIELQSLKER